MRVEIPDHAVRQFLGASKRTNLNEALLDWLYRDPRFDTAREKVMGDWLMRTLKAHLQAGIDVSGGGDDGQ